MTLESGPKNTGVAPEALRIVRTIELHRTMFAEGTIGFSLFPSALEGRRRAETTFGQPLESLFGRRKPRDLSVLKEIGILTVSDLLALPSEDEKLQGLKNLSKLKMHLSEYLEDLVQTPQGKLIERVFGERQRKDIPMEREQELIDAVNKALDTLPERARLILQFRFGLFDGITRTFTEVGKSLSLSRERIRQAQATAERRLKHPSRRLNQYLTLPKKSFVQEAFGLNVVFQKDLPPLPSINLAHDPNLSPATQSELKNHGVLNLYPTISDIAMADIGSFPFSDLSEEVRKEIKEALRKAALDFAKQKEEEKLARQRDIFVAPEKPTPVNNLLPQSLISEEQLTSLASLEIQHLNLSGRVYNALRRNGITTVGDLLRYTGKEIWGISLIGRQSVVELAGKLAKSLQLTEEDHSKILNHFSQATRRVSPRVKEHMSAEMIRQELLLKAQETDKKNMEKIREIISQANTAGFTSAEQILEWTRRQNIRVLNFNPHSVFAKMIIEYVLSHPAS